MSFKEFGRGEKRKADDVSVEEVYKEFLETFEGGAKKATTMSWIRGDVVNADKTNQQFGTQNNKLYKPKSKLEELAASFKSTKDVRMKKEDETITKRPNLKNDKKRSSNLENLKEELKRSQEEREQRRRLRTQIESLKPDDGHERKSSGYSASAALRDDILPMSGSYESDPNSTNIYIANLDSKISEASLCEVFGKFGPLASVKIMWPRTDEERLRGKNAGFVAFMNRVDAERCIAVLQNRVLNGVVLRLGWGKSIAIPPNPIYMPPKLAELVQPQPPTGLPFSCALPTPSETKDARVQFEANPHSAESEKNIERAVIRVVIPTERAILHIVHRMVEFVCREGPMFEAIIMNREMNNPLFRFLFDNKSPVHIYYRWKLYSVLHGEPVRKWRTEDFRMFKGGSLWRPPPMNLFTQSLPLNLLPKEDELPPLSDGNERDISPNSSYHSGNRDRDRHRHSSSEDSFGESFNSSRSRGPPPPKPVQSESRKSNLSDKQKVFLEEMLKELTADRRKVADCMVWCLDHAQYSEDIVACIAESLSTIQTPLPKKIARLYLVSDLLHNAGAKVPFAFSFRKVFQNKLVDIFGDLHTAYESADYRMKKEQFKSRVMSCFRAWEQWAIYPNDFIIYLQNVFFGLVKLKDDKSDDEDIEGEPVSLVDQLDGEPIINEDAAGLLSSLYGKQTVVSKEPTVEKTIPNKGPTRKSETNTSFRPAFQSSKWEEVAPEQVEAQAVTTSRWDYFEGSSSDSQEGKNRDGRKGAVADDDVDDDIDGEAIDDSEMIQGSEDLLARMRAVSAARAQAAALTAASTTPVASRRDEGMTEERRNRLREIELQVIEYQDDLESGQMPRENGISIAHQVQRYRENLLSQASQPCSGGRGAASGGKLSEKSSSKSSSTRRRSRSRSPRNRRSNRY